MKKHFRQPNQSMSLDCKILFKKNASKAFYIGQTVHGYVHLVLEHEQLIQSIHVRINGTISAEWQHKHQTHQCQVNCLDHQISVLGWNLYRKLFSFQCFLVVDTFFSFKNLQTMKSVWLQRRIVFHSNLNFHRRCHCLSMGNLVTFSIRSLSALKCHFGQMLRWRNRFKFKKLSINMIRNFK